VFAIARRSWNKKVIR